MFEDVFWVHNSSVRFKEAQPKETNLNGPICVCQRKRKRRFSQRLPRSAASTRPRKWPSCSKSRRVPSRTGFGAGSCQPCAMVVSCGFGLKTWRSLGKRSEDLRNWRNERLEGIPDVYLMYTFDLLYDSASPNRGRYIVADAAMDKPCLYSTLRLLVRQWPIRGSPIPLHLMSESSPMSFLECV